MPQGDNVIVVLVVAILGAGGIGATMREIIGVFTKVFGGMSIREDKRKRDLVQEARDAVIAFEAEAKKRRVLEEAYAVLRRLYIENRPTEAPPLPAWPEYGSTLTAEQVRRIREGETPE